jgi:exosortase B
MAASVVSSLTNQPRAEAISAHARWVWLPIVAGALLLYVPAYVDLANAVASKDGSSQQPVCLAIWLWTLWRQRTVFGTFAMDGRGALGGWLLIAFAAVCYAIGRSQEFFQFEIGSQVPLFAGIVLVLMGRSALRKLWFSLIFLAFIVPAPGSLLNEILVPLKKVVSAIVAQLLYSAGLPIARDGVVLYVGHYQLLIADACAGLNSMVALSAIGVLYVYLAGYRRWLPNAILLGAVLPIAFVANVLRVMGLVLVTYRYGEDAGERFHDYAAYAEVVVVFVAFFFLDRMLRVAFDERVAPPQVTT